MLSEFEDGVFTRLGKLELAAQKSFFLFTSVLNKRLTNF